MSALVHYGNAVGFAFVVAVENALCVARYGGIYAVIGGDKVLSRFKHGGALFFVGRIGEAIGVGAYVYIFGAAAVAFVKLAFFESAFNVFHFFLLFKFA